MNISCVFRSVQTIVGLLSGQVGVLVANLVLILKANSVLDQPEQDIEALHKHQILRECHVLL